MKIAIKIEDKILKQLTKYTGVKSSTKAVNNTLIAVIKNLKIEKLKSLRGKFQIKNNWKQLRALEIKEARGIF